MSRKFQFVEFEGRGTGPRDEIESKRPRVSIRKDASIAWNQVADDALGNPRRVVLMFDAGARAIGLRAATDADAHGYTVSREGRTSGRFVRPRAFLGAFDIDTSESRRYPAVVDDGVLIVELEPAGA